MPLSGRSVQATGALSASLSAQIEAEPGLDAGDIAFTWQLGRAPMTGRRIAFGRTARELAAALAAPADEVTVVTPGAASPASSTADLIWADATGVR